MLIRLLALDACLSNFGKKFFMDDLVDKCNEALAEVGCSVKPRQVKNDMDFIESEVGCATTIEKIYEGKKKYYRYESRAVSIKDKLPLVNNKELAILQSAIGILQKVKGLPHYDWLEEVVPRLSRHFDKTKISKEVIDFEDNKLLKGKNYLGDLFQYILEEKALQVHYHPFDQAEPSVWIIHPYYLKQHNQRWFCRAYVQQEERINNLALDRIIEIRVISMPYIPNTFFEPDVYFKDIIGVTRFEEEVLTKISFRIVAHRAQYILTKPFHHSQVHLPRKKDAEGWEYFTIEVVPNNELTAKILELGDHIEIVSPESVRAKLQERLYKAINLYLK